MISHRNTISAVALVAMVTASGAVAHEKSREQGAHQHGHGTLELAVEKSTVTLELRMPGNDVVGFEHAAKTAKEKKAVEDAKRRLADPIKLFGVPAAAGCSVTASDVHTHTGDEEHKAETGATPQKETKAETETKPEADAHEHEHSSFHAKYTLTCTTPHAIKALDIALFSAFRGSQELEVVAVSEKGQVKAEATRKAPKVSLGGLW